MRSLLTCGLVLLGVAAKAQELPRYQLSLKDGSELPKFLKSNSWVNDLQKTNLYEGLSLRIAPLMGALPGDAQKSWKGRIADTFVELALKNRPVHIEHYHKPGLVQPIGLSVQGIGELEAKAVRALVESLRTLADQKIEGIGKKPITVTPISIANQKLAVKISGSCLAISRDPRVAIWSWQNCLAAKPLDSDARVRVDLDSLAGGTEKAMEEFLGIRRNAVATFAKADDGTYTLTNATIPLTHVHVLKNTKLGEAQLAALPSTTNFLARVAVPMPKDISPETIKAFLKEGAPGWRKAKPVVASYFHLGATRLKEGGVVAESGILIDKGSSSFTEEAWAQVFEPSFGHDVFVKDVCGKKMTLITPRDTVVKAVESACGGKVPTLAQIPKEMKDILALGDGAQSVLLNVGQTLSQMVDLGWTVENEGKPQPAEIQEAKKVLARLPAFVIGGKAGKESIAYQAKQGVY